MVGTQRDPETRTSRTSSVQHYSAANSAQVLNPLRSNTSPGLTTHHLSSPQVVLLSLSLSTYLASLLLPTCVEPVPKHTEQATGRGRIGHCPPWLWRPNSHHMREPCRPFSRLAMTDGMDRTSGDPLVQLGRVTREAGQRERRAGRQARRERPHPHALGPHATHPHPHAHGTRKARLERRTSGGRARRGRAEGAQRRR